MKKLISILLITSVLVLAFIIMNSNNEHDMLYPESSISLTKGVDFTHINTKGHSNPLGRYNQSPINKGLISDKQGLLSSKNDILSENLYSHLPENNSFARGRIPIAINSNQSMGSGNASYGISLNKRTDSRSPEVMGGSVMIPFGGSKRSYSTTQGTSSGILAVSSGLNNSGRRAAAPLDPFGDYIENDITHPGEIPWGNPLGHSVPVGSGTLPFLLFVSVYVLMLHKNQKKILISK